MTNSNANGPYPTAAGTWEVRYREGSKHRSRTFKLETDALAFIEEVNTRTGPEPIVRRKDVPTVEVWLAQWLARKKKLAPTTKRRYIEAIETHIRPTLGHLSLLDLSPALMQDWQDRRLAEGAGPVVLARAQSILFQALNKAVLPYQFLTVNPIAALEKPEHVAKRPRWLTAFDVEAIRLVFAAWDDPGSAALVSVLAYVGVRPQDALALTWTDIRGQRLNVVRKNMEGEIVEGGKTGEGYRRTVHLPSMVRADLLDWKRTSGAPHDLIFPRANDGEPWRRHNYENWVSRKQMRRHRGRRPTTVKPTLWRPAVAR